MTSSTQGSLPANGQPTPPHAAHEEAAALKEAFRAMLERLCAWAQVPIAEREQVLSTNALMLGDIPFTLELEEWSSFVKVFVDVGKPAAEDAPRLHRHLLNQQLFQPAPFFMVPAVHPETDHIVLCANSPLPVDEDGDERFFGFLQGCALACDALRAGAPEIKAPD